MGENLLVKNILAAQCPTVLKFDMLVHCGAVSHEIVKIHFR